MTVQALYKFDATDPTDLALSPGDLIDVAKVDDGEWGMGISRTTGNKGAFPWTYVENKQHNSPNQPNPTQRQPNPSRFIQPGCTIGGHTLVGGWCSATRWKGRPPLVCCYFLLC